MTLGIRSAAMAGMVAISALAWPAVGSAQSVAQWNTLVVSSVGDSDNAGSEMVSVSPTAAYPVEAGCPFSDFYVVRDPLVLRGSLALLTSAAALGWQVQVLTSGLCDLSQRPLVTAVRIYSPN